ncbi:MAG TPA: hypothetical protein VM432_13535 [Bdellovibrionales bacterium]|nr:hypothetical protein [Bdellovibrionales bacterium]
MSDFAVLVTFAAGYILTGMFVLGATISQTPHPVKVRSNPKR